MSTEQILELTKISKLYGAKLILDQISFSMNRSDRVGLVGENGAGKTTLARIILGDEIPDEGRIRLLNGAQIGYLPQEAVLEDELSVQAYLERAMGRIDQIKVALTELEVNLSAPASSADLTALMDRYGALQAEFARRGGYEIDYRLDQVLTGLQLDQVERSRSLRTLSGGEKTRLALAGLLLQSPDLLVLDEPTNHLDFAAVDWLESYLLTYPGAILLISHDRHFLNKVVTYIAELSPVTHQLTIYPGNYDAFLAAREREWEKQAQAYEQQQGEIKALQRLIKAKTHNAGKGRPPTDNNKMAYDGHVEKVQQNKSREIANAKKRLERIAADPVVRPSRRWRINPDFSPDELVSREIIRLKDVSKSFGERTLFRGVTATILSGERIVILGPNGLGKTTLLKIILGLEGPDCGSVRIANGAQIGYLDQEQETLELKRTVLEEYSRDLIGTENEHRANLHKYGLFAEDQVLQPIGSLSIGQRRKLQIAKLIARRVNVLLLDEPTNHLDLESVEQFEWGLVEFPGTVLAISHDRTFTAHVATQTWTFSDGQLVQDRHA